jgi:uncharacterized membrane protein YfbV (UPF0208 family)
MRDTIQRIIGLAVGVLIALILLAVMTDVTVAEAIGPLVVGAVAAFFWPIVALWFLARRARERRDNQIQDEVQRQMNEQKRG